MVTLKLNIFRQLTEDAKTDSFVNSQEEVHDILFFKVSFIRLAEGSHKASCFCFLDSNIWHLGAGVIDFVWDGHSLWHI